MVVKKRILIGLFLGTMLSAGLLSGIWAVRLATPARANTTIALQLPWPTGQYHNINGGDTYGCGFHIHADYYAIDFVSQIGEPVSAIAAGTVHLAVRNDYGNFIVIHHANGFASLYAHLSAFAVREGQQVAQGQVIGYSGNTGGVPPHLHLTVYQNIAASDNTPFNDGFAHAYRPEPMSGVTNFSAMGIHDTAPPDANGNGNVHCVSGTGRSNLMSIPPGILGHTLLRGEVNTDGVGVTQNNKPVRLRENIDVQIFNASNTLVRDIGIYSTYSSKTGTYIGLADLGTGWSFGTYSVKEKLFNSLREKVSQVVIANTARVVLPNLYLPGGDADGNNIIDGIDYNYLLRSWKTSDASADFDRSGMVEAVDYNILLRNFGKRGL
jgi:murein DD-endopeptidase MepM/ murein hydrolase activator NlpD